MRLIKQKNQWAQITERGDIVKILKVNLPEVSNLADDRLGFTKNGKDGVVDYEGNVICPPIYHRVSRFVEGLACVELGGKTGYINLAGELVIPCAFDWAHPFSCGLAAVEESPTSPWGYLNQHGEYVIPPRFRSVHSFSENLGAVHMDAGWGFLNPAGNLVLNPKYFIVNDFHEGLCAVTTSAKTLIYGFIDPTGNYQIQPAFLGADMKFSEGLAAIAGDNGYGFIDRTGKLVISCQFFDTSHFVEGICRVTFKRKGKFKWGYINSVGQMILAPVYDFATDFSGGLATVEVDHYRGFIDKQGKFVWRELITD